MCYHNLANQNLADHLKSSPRWADAVEKAVLDLFGIFFRQPLDTNRSSSPWLIGAVLISFMSICSNYELYFTSEITVPTAFNPYKRVQDMISDGYTIWYDGQPTLAKLINDFATQNISHTGNQTFVEEKVRS